MPLSPYQFLQGSGYRMSTIPRISFFQQRVEHNESSSTRFRNSGRMVSRSRSFIHFSFLALSVACLVRSVTFSASWIRWLPILLVMMMVFLKFTTTAFIIRSGVSSSTCSNAFHTSGNCFSVSSSSTMLYGLRRTASVNWPPSSYPTYPGGYTYQSLTVCFPGTHSYQYASSCFHHQTNYSARALASSVLPTGSTRENKDLLVYADHAIILHGFCGWHRPQPNSFILAYHALNCRCSSGSTVSLFFTL